MDVFERKKTSVWIPHQAGIEFQRRRVDVQQYALDAYERLGTDLTKYIARKLSALDMFQADFQQRIAAAVDGTTSRANRGVPDDN